MIRRAGAIALAVGFALATATAAQASAITDQQLHSLASRAASGHAAALAALRAVDRVDGQQVQIAPALNAASRSELDARLAALAAHGQSPAISAIEAQAGAAAVLHTQGYNRAPLPDPVATVVKKLGSLLGKLAAGAPGGPVVFWAVLAVLALALASYGARRMMRRLEPTARAVPGARTGGAVDPARLERDAEAAEARGAFAEAIRLRFQAGLLALGARGTLDYRPSLLTGEARRRLRSGQFDELAARFEQVTYGRTPARAPDAAAAREGWRSLLAAREKR